VFVDVTNEEEEEEGFNSREERLGNNGVSPSSGVIRRGLTGSEMSIEIEFGVEVDVNGGGRVVNDADDVEEEEEVVEMIADDEDEDNGGNNVDVAVVAVVAVTTVAITGVND
jgi:hypothetical protein